MKKHYYIWPTIVALALSLGIFVGGKLHFNDTPEKLFTTNSKKDKLNRLIEFSTELIWSVIEPILSHDDIQGALIADPVGTGEIDIA